MGAKLKAVWDAIVVLVDLCKICRGNKKCFRSSRRICLSTLFKYTSKFLRHCKADSVMTTGLHSRLSYM